MSGKSKRAREKKRMEAQEELQERIGSWLANDMTEMPEGPFHACNMQLVSAAHAEFCDGDCEPIDKWAVGLNYETFMCHKMGFDHEKQLNSNAWITETKLIATLELLKEKGLITQEEIDTEYRKTYYMRLHHVRTVEYPIALENAKKMQARQQIIAPPGFVPPQNGHQ